ncbi:hypothetical protein [Streptomyces sp. NBC_01262]|jgi:hypothetical protein|uniref:hypothetical protein n=1 Tax=Streptomyces sp. NBC_01262 TaxID=2903803 RepID=UPI002E3382C9|nr:hypothetical protein [Streptomyces sp. NBC_01262]
MSESGILRVSTEDLRNSGSGLRYVATEFEGLDRMVDAYDDTVGHDRLAEKLRDFSDSWNDNRTKMIESIKGLAESAIQAAETYEQIDTELVDVLLGKGDAQ